MFPGFPDNGTKPGILDESVVVVVVGHTAALLGVVLFLGMHF